MGGEPGALFSVAQTATPQTIRNQPFLSFSQWFIGLHLQIWQCCVDINLIVIRHRPGVHSV